MIQFTRPSDAQVAAFTRGLAKSPFSYREIGCTSSGPTKGYASDRSRVQLGHGGRVFLAARDALRNWKMFQLGWVDVADRNCPIEAGRDVAVIARLFPAWILCGCRIVRVIDEPGRYGFAYGTLTQHVEQGEELFLLERDASDAVWYEIVAVSRPARWYVTLGYPLARLLQRRFREYSSAAMRRAVETAQ